MLLPSSMLLCLMLLPLSMLFLTQSTLLNQMLQSNNFLLLQHLSYLGGDNNILGTLFCLSQEFVQMFCCNSFAGVVLHHVAVGSQLGGGHDAHACCLPISCLLITEISAESTSLVTQAVLEGSHFKGGEDMMHM